MSNGVVHHNGATATAVVKLRRTSPVGEEASTHSHENNSASSKAASVVTVSSFDQPRPMPILPSSSSDAPGHRMTRPVLDGGDQRIAGGLVEEVMSACSTQLNGLQTPQRVRLASPELDGSPTPRAPSSARDPPPTMTAGNRPSSRVLDLSNVSATKRTMRSDEIQSIYTGGKSKGQPDGAGLSPVIESPVHAFLPFPTSSTATSKPKTPPPPPPPPPAQVAPVLSPPRGAIEALGIPVAAAAAAVRTSDHSIRTSDHSTNGSIPTRHEPTSVTNITAPSIASTTNGKPPMSPPATISAKTAIPSKPTTKVRHHFRLADFLCCRINIFLRLFGHH